MPKKGKRSRKGGSRQENRNSDDSPNELWIAPRYSLKGPAGERAWENRPGGAPNSGKYLELADIALGLKKPESKKRRNSTPAHVTSKTEPYSS